MTSRFVRPCLAAFLLVSTISAQAQPANPATPPPASNPADPLVQLKLPDADIDTVLSTLEIFTGRTVLRTAGLPTTNYNLKIVDPIPKSQAITAIETVLMLNNVGVSKLGDKFLIVTVLPQIKTAAPEWINGSAFDQPPSGKIAVKVFQLDFLRATEMQAVLQQITNPNLAIAPVIFPNANAIMVTDSVTNLQRIEALLQQIDKPSMAGLKPKFYQLTNGASAANVVSKLRSILGSGTLQQQLGTATTYQADERTNQIILITDPRQYPFFDDLIARLDVKADPNTRNEVIYLKHANALKLKDVLAYVIQGQAAAQQRQQSQGSRPGQNAIPNVQPVVPNVPGVQPAPAPGSTAALAASALEGVGAGSAEFSQVLTLAPDERSNSIVVSGTADDIRLITALIDKLDNVLAQVRIEVVIAEVSLDDNHSSGISQLGLQVQGDRLVGINGSSVGLGLGGTVGTDGSTSGFATTSRIGGPGSLARSLDLTGIFNVGSTPRKNNATILSVPSITTSHAKPATFISSEKRPITTGTTSTPTSGTTSGFSTQQQVTQQDIGITLTVTPLIGSDGSVQLDIDQDVQDVAGTVLVNGDEQPIISHRQAKSTITAMSGDIMVIGGMQRNKDTRATNRLGPIPFLGDLFGQRTKTVTRTELIFFMRPYVLTNTPADNVEMMKRIDELPANEVPQKADIKHAVDPTAPAPQKKGLLDHILPH